MKKTTVRLILLLQMCIFLLLLTACTTPGGKQPEGSKSSFAEREDDAFVNSSELIQSRDEGSSLEDGKKISTSNTISSGSINYESYNSSKENYSSYSANKNTPNEEDYNSARNDYSGNIDSGVDDNESSNDTNEIYLPVVP